MELGFLYSDIHALLTGLATVYPHIQFVPLLVIHKFKYFTVLPKKICPVVMLNFSGHRAFINPLMVFPHVMFSLFSDVGQLSLMLNKDWSECLQMMLLSYVKSLQFWMCLPYLCDNIIITVTRVCCLVVIITIIFKQLIMFCEEILECLLHVSINSLACRQFSSKSPHHRCTFMF